jgi:hypothetical protein
VVILIGSWLAIGVLVLAKLIQMNRERMMSEMYFFIIQKRQINICLYLIDLDWGFKRITLSF